MTTVLSPSVKAQVFAEMLPHLQALQGKIIVVKYGGNAMTDQSLQKSFAHDIALLKLLGLRPIVVHGGGPQIDLALQRLGKKGQFIQGMRVTDEETMEVVEWVLAGQVQQDIVMMIQQAGATAIGLTGKDGGLIHAQQSLIPSIENPEKTIDLGYVGEITTVNTALLNTLIHQDIIPVISPIGFDPQAGQAYNINADLVAGKIAQVLQADKLLLMTNISGVLDKEGNVLRELCTERINALIKDGTITGGMIPKISSALETANLGINAVHIVDGRVPHCLLLEMLTHEGSGTMIYR